MEVKQQMQKIRNMLDDVSVDRTRRVRAIAVSGELDQLEVEIVKALQAARQEGWDAGHRWMCIKRLAAGKGD